MLNLEEQADNAKARELYWKPMGWLGEYWLGVLVSCSQVLDRDGRDL
jgi:hypothetical protein